MTFSLGEDRPVMHDTGKMFADPFIFFPYNRAYVAMSFRNYRVDISAVQYSTRGYAALRGDEAAASFGKTAFRCRVFRRVSTVQPIAFFWWESRLSICHTSSG